MCCIQYTRILQCTCRDTSSNVSGVHTQKSTHMVSKLVLRPRGSVHDEPARIQRPGGGPALEVCPPGPGGWTRVSLVLSCRDAACWKPGRFWPTVYTPGGAAASSVYIPFSSSGGFRLMVIPYQHFFTFRQKKGPSFCGTWKLIYFACSLNR